jgi:glycosyltransferase involved in cell wall biosynthesis
VNILVYLHHLELGGSQLNALDLAARARAGGHHVTLVGTRGPATDAVRALAAARGLTVSGLPQPARRPSGAQAARLAALARRLRPDLVHAYEWQQCLEAYWGVHQPFGIPLVTTVYAMTVPRWLPPAMPLIVGTGDLARAARAARRGPVTLVEPPVDTATDHPGFDAAGLRAAEFRAAHGLAAPACLLVVVSRLVHDMKLEGISRTIDAVGALAAGGIPVRLAVVGGGPAAAVLAARAAEVNRRAGAPVIVLTGPLTDPRPAYAAADVVLGMGGSALRGMAFAKPVVVLGAGGFARLVTPASAPVFGERTGFYGDLAGGEAADPLGAVLADLIASPARRAALGAFGRDVVERRYALPAAAAAVEQVYAAAVASPRRAPPARAAEGARVFAHRFAAERLPPAARLTLRTRLSALPPVWTRKRADIRTLARPVAGDLDEWGRG